MSIADNVNTGSSFIGMPQSFVRQSTCEDRSTTGDRPLHRVGEIRRRQGVSLRTVARRLGTSMEQIRRQEDATCDMKVSQLHQWQQALQVPLAELLVDLDPPLSEPVLTRARLLKVMKTVRAIKEIAEEDSLQRFCTMLEEQLIELMPELQDVSPWHSVGQRRTQEELGRVAERALPESFFTDMHG